jgi:hypothetical protein
MSWIIDTEKLAQQLLTPVVAKMSHLEWVRVLLSPISTLNAVFVTYRAELIKRLRYNGQVIILEALLNDIFHPSGREIYIETIDDRLAQLYVFQTSENQDAEHIHQSGEAPPVYIFGAEESISVGYDFIVWVPDELLSTEEEQRIKAVVRRYKLAGKQAAYRYFNGNFF